MRCVPPPSPTPPTRSPMNSSLSQPLTGRRIWIAGIGGEIPQLGGNARAGGGLLVVEGDESDRSVAALRPDIAVLLNVDLDHHATFSTRAEVGDLFETWLEQVPHVVRAEDLEPVRLELAVAGEHNRRNAAAAIAAPQLAGVSRAEVDRVIVEF